MVMFSLCESCCRQGSWQLEAADVLSFPRFVVCLQAGVNPNAPLDSNHMTALMISSMMGNWDRPRPERFDKQFRCCYDGACRVCVTREHAQTHSGRILFNCLLKTSKLTWMAHCLAQDVSQRFLFRTHMGGASLPAGLRAIDYAGYEVICFKRVMIHFQSLHPC